MPETWLLGNKEDVFRNQLMQDSRVVNVSTSGYLPAGPSNNNNFLVYPETNSTQLVKTLRYDVDYDYMPTLGMQLAAGRNFSKTYGTDSSGVILNETAAKTFGWSKQGAGSYHQPLRQRGTESNVPGHWRCEGFPFQIDARTHFTTRHGSGANGRHRDCEGENQRHFRLACQPETTLESTHRRGSLYLLVSG